MPPRPWDIAIGTLNEAVPVEGFTENFSSIPRIAPPPLGSDSVGAIGTALDVLAVLLDGFPEVSPAAVLDGFVCREGSAARGSAIFPLWAIPDHLPTQNNSHRMSRFYEKSNRRSAMAVKIAIADRKER